MTFLIVVLVLVAAAVLGTFAYMWLRAKNKEPLSECNWDELKDRSSYLQSCVTVVALIVAAGWVVHTWTIQWEDHKKSQEDHEKSEKANALETELAGLQVNISARQERPPEANRKKEFFIAGDIFFKNAGTRRTIIRMADGPLFVAKIRYVAPFINNPARLVIGAGTAMEIENLKKLNNPANEECQAAKIQFDSPKRFWLSRPSIDGRPDIEVQDEIRPGEEDQFHFILRVEKRGTYAVMFSSEDEEKKAQPYSDDLGPCVPKGKKAMKPRWESAASFVEVK